MTNQKIILGLTIEENSFGGITCKHTIIDQSQEILTEDFKERIYDDLGFEI